MENEFYNMKFLGNFSFRNLERLVDSIKNILKTLKKDVFESFVKFAGKYQCCSL